MSSHYKLFKNISFLDHIRYKEDAVNTKAGVCITTDKLRIVQIKLKKIIVKSVLFEIAKLLKKYIQTQI